MNHRPIILLTLLFFFSAVITKAQYNYYFGNLHAHTDYSDGGQDGNAPDPAAAYTYAKNSSNFHFLGLSEHNHPEGGLNITVSKYHTAIAQATTANQDGTFVCMLGMEWGTLNDASTNGYGGHMLIYGIDSLVAWTAGNYDIYVAKGDYPSLLNKVKSKQPGAFAYLAHPESNDFSQLKTTSYNSNYDDAIVGMAMRSGSATSTNTDYTISPVPSSNESYYKDMLARGYHLAPGIDHDNHNTNFGRHTQGRTVVLANSLTRTNVMDALLNQRFYASDDYNLKLNFTISSQPMGSTMTGAGAPTISVSVTDNDGENVSSISVQSAIYSVNSATTASTLTSNSNLSTLSYTDNSITDGQTKYYYIVVTQSDGHKAWSAPIWYTRNNSLPVKLIDFNGKYENKNIELNWATASESNNHYFSIERSLEGKEFEEIGKVNGNGTSTSINNYQFVDTDPVQGINYYRLNQIDFDGASVISKLISVNTSKDELEIIKVVHVSENFNIELYYPDNSEANLEIFDISGKKILNTKLNLMKGYNSFSITAPEINKGIHLVRISNGIFSVTKKIVF
jgi:trimeric autotransporter adhesin